MGGGDADPRFRKVVLLGFDAVPALIDHLDDRRRTKVEPFPCAGYHLQLRHVVSEILVMLAGEELRRRALREDGGVYVRQIDVEAWWKKARVIGEESYLVCHALEQKKWPHEGMVAIIGRKYPRRLGELYRSLLDERPEMLSARVTEAIGASSLDRDRKREFLSYGLRSNKLKHRFDALGPLLKVDARLFESRLVQELTSLPRTSKLPFWNCPEAFIAHFVCETKEPAVWKSFTSAAERAEVGLRMEFLERIYCSLETAHTWTEQLAFLAHFLEDKTVRDVSSAPNLYVGPYAGSGHDDKGRFPRIEVRNHAARCIAVALDLAIQEEPRPEWNAGQWADFRQQVREALLRKRMPTRPTKDKERGH
jgi:hypothetical protein